MSREDATLARAVDRRDTGQESLAQIRDRIIREDPETLPACAGCVGTGQAGPTAALGTCTTCGGDGVDDDRLDAMVEDAWESQWLVGAGDRWADLFADPEDLGVDR